MLAIIIMTTVIAKIKKNIKQEDNCEIWTGRLSQCGHPQIYFNKKSYYIAKYIWNFNNPDNLIDNKSTCNHTCNNNLCVKLEHLLKISRTKEINYKDIWERLLKNGERQEDGCLLWNGTILPTGYGQSSLQGYPILIHRLSCMIKMNVTELDKNNGDVRLFVRHLCNNRLCFEPDHLQLGTQYENDYEDKIENGTLPRGETHYNSSITEELAQQIKNSKPILNPNFKTQEERANQFDVSIKTIKKIDKGSVCEIISQEIQAQIKKSFQPRYLGKYKTQEERAKEYGVTLQIIKCIDCCKSWANLQDINGNTSSKRKIKSREFRKNAKEKEWTSEMWIEAKKRLEIKSELQIENNKFIGTPCINWKGTLQKSGYGTISIFGRIMPVHILSCSIKNKRHRKEDEVTRHLCGNKLCINKHHLQFGTNSENMIDNINHGKSNAKFTKDDILDIRNKSLNENFTQVELGKIYNTRSTYIGSIIKNNIWKHIK